MDPTYPVIVAVPILGLAVYCLTQVSIARLLPGRSPYLALAAGFVAGFVVTTATSAVVIMQSGFPRLDGGAFLVLNAVTYLSLAWGYFNFVNVTIASVRVRLLGDLLAAGRPLPRATLLAAYNSRKVIDIRIDRLVRGGHLVEQDGRYFLGKKRFLMVARVYNFLRWAIIGPWPDDHWPAAGANAGRGQ